PASRRKFTRYHCTGGVELRRNEGSAPVFANLSDISLEGCYVEAVSTLAAGSEVLFLMRVRDAQIRGRALVKTSNHPVGMGLEFLHMGGEDQQRLEFLVGTLAGTQEMQTEEKRVIVAEDPIIRTPIPRPTRQAAAAPISQPARAATPQGNGAMSQK